MNYNQLKNKYYDLVLFNFENQNYVIDKRLKIFAKKS